MNCEHGLYTKERCRKRAQFVEGVPIWGRNVNANGERDVILGYRAVRLCKDHAEGKERIITIKEYEQGDIEPLGKG